LVSTSGGSFHGFMDEQLQRLGRRRSVVVSVDHFLLVPSLLATTDHVSTLPSRLAASFGDAFDSFVLPFDAEGFTLHVGWHPRHHADPGLAWLRGMILPNADADAA
jgi:DNA-binding transcriptional LysR family regulator